MKINNEEYAEKIFKVIISVMKIKDDDLCFCGSGKKYKKCCGRKEGRSIIFTKKAFDNVLKYKKSQNGIIKQIPQGLFRQFEKASINRFFCLYPNCENKPISCHLIPENSLKINFGNHCLESKPQDQANKSVYTKIGINKATTLPVFCEKHDNDLFHQPSF